MGTAIITMKFMPESPETDREAIKKTAIEIIEKYTGENPESYKVQEEPVAFGLVSVIIMFAMDESKELDPLQEQLSDIEGVNSCEVADMRRVIG